MKSTTIAQLQEKVEQHRVKGFLAADEAAALYGWALEVASLGPCLEVGSYCGKSSIYLASACRQRGAVLYALDHHRGSEEHQFGEEYHDADLFDDEAQVVDSFPTFRANIGAFDLSDHVIAVVAASERVVQAWATPLSMVFIDGGHSHQAAINDCVSWSRHVLPGGVLAIHDVFANPADGGQGPYLGLQSVLAEGGYQWVESVRSLAILQRRRG